MSGLKPIGSEKLEGMDKIRRIMEIARYNEVLPQPVNENESKEYSLGLADGNNYEIVRERQGYIIKMTINESETDYIEPMKNRKYFSSYSQALKKLNLMAKEFNTLYENTEGTSLFNEQKKKYKLKLKKPKADLEPAAEPAPVEPPIPAPAPELPPAPEIPAEPAPPPPLLSVPDCPAPLANPNVYPLLAIPAVPEAVPPPPPAAKPYCPLSPKVSPPPPPPPDLGEIIESRYDSSPGDPS